MRQAWPFFNTHCRKLREERQANKNIANVKNKFAYQGTLPHQASVLQSYLVPWRINRRNCLFHAHSSQRTVSFMLQVSHVRGGKTTIRINLAFWRGWGGTWGKGSKYIACMELLWQRRTGKFYCQRCLSFRWLLISSEDRQKGSQGNLCVMTRSYSNTHPFVMWSCYAFGGRPFQRKGDSAKTWYIAKLRFVCNLHAKWLINRNPG